MRVPSGPLGKTEKEKKMTVKVTWSEYGFARRASCIDMAEAASYYIGLRSRTEDIQGIQIDGKAVETMDPFWIKKALDERAAKGK